MVERGGRRISVGGIAQQEQDGRDSGGDLGSQSTPSLDDPARIRLVCLERVGSNLGRCRALTLQRSKTHGADQTRLAAVRLVDRRVGDGGVGCDRLDSCRGVAVLVEAVQRGIEQGGVGLARSFESGRRVVATAPLTLTGGWLSLNSLQSTGMKEGLLTMTAQPTNLVDRLRTATNAHDLDAIADCFADTYRNETPVHPARNFVGRQQVRANWEHILAAVPDVTAEVIRQVVDGDVVWSEWEMRGTRRDGQLHLMRGVIIFGVNDDRATWARFYLEPAELDDKDADAAVRAIVGTA